MLPFSFYCLLPIAYCPSSIPCCLLPIACLSRQPLPKCSPTFQTTSPPTSLAAEFRELGILILRVEKCAKALPIRRGFSFSARHFGHDLKGHGFSRAECPPK